jgi:UDP:flavonoid glycosyltransferase YjiC (YdhE family)
MASIVLVSIPAQGHVAPLLAIARGFVERGDDVRFITGARFAEKIAATGASHIPLPPEIDYDETLFDRYPERAKLKGLKAAAFDVEHVFAHPARAQYEIVMAAHTAQPADVVLAEPLFTGATILLGHPRTVRPPVVMCGVVPLPIGSVDIAPFGLGLPPARWGNRQRNALLASITRRMLARANSIIDGQYHQVHGKHLPCSLVDWGTQADAIVQFTVPAFEYPRSDAPATLHFAGPLGAAGSQAALPDWWSDLDSTRPVVHVTQGTVANFDYRQAIAPTLEALADEDVLDCPSALVQ